MIKVQLYWLDIAFNLYFSNSSSLIPFNIFSVCLPSPLLANFSIRYIVVGITLGLALIYATWIAFPAAYNILFAFYNLGIPVCRFPLSIASSWLSLSTTLACCVATFLIFSFCVSFIVSLFLSLSIVCLLNAATMFGRLPWSSPLTAYTSFCFLLLVIDPMESLQPLYFALQSLLLYQPHHRGCD